MTSLRDEPRGGRRAQQKARTRRVIQQEAMRLFLAKGFEATTVEEIAAAAGVSHMTFFRHFPTKEAVVEADDHDPRLGELIRGRPAQEGPLTAVHRAVRQGLAVAYPGDGEAALARTRLILQTPALRARRERALDAVSELVAQALAQREGTEVTLATRALAAAAVAVLDTAVTAWAAGAGADDLGTLVDTAFHALTGRPTG